MNKSWALFLSGRGSTAQSALELSAEANLRLVVSSKSSAYGLKRARRAGIPTLVLDKKIDWDSLHQILIQRKIDRIFLLGFMKIVPEKFVQLWPKKIFNIHPSLLPDFKGAHGFQESFESPMAWMGVTIHEVTEGMDEGPQRLQKKVLSATEKKEIFHGSSSTADEYW
jgi:phosphoribosylglycinamide formyltransferase-1